MKTKLLSLLVLIGTGVLFASSSGIKNNTQKPFIIVLDAGHGGHDSGNTGNGYVESTIALNIVKKVGERLQNEPGIKIIYTRTDNTFVTLKGRAAVANKADADLFVSVHCDAFTNNASGASTFVLGLHRSKDNFEIAKKENEVIFLEENYEETYAGFDPNSPESFIGLTILQEEYLDQSILLAGLVQNNFANVLKRKDRSVRQAGFLVLRETYMPSVLIETGFLTNKEEGAYLNSKNGQTEMAREIAKGIISYKQNLALGTSDAQNPVITQDEIDAAINVSEEKGYTDVTFKVQLAAGSKKVATEAYNFKGLKNVSREKIGSLYKYFYGNTSNYSEIQRLKVFAQEKGYASAYVVAFKDGQKVKLSEVLAKPPKE
jgi:N-acetylmuramoyl-L-alanine amidase